MLARSVNLLPLPGSWRPEATADPRGYFRYSTDSLVDEKSLSPDTDLCGQFLEIFQDWGGGLYRPEFLQEVAAFAKEYDMLTALDKIQARFGSTGKLLSYMHYEVEPDLLYLGKDTSSSLALSIVLSNAPMMGLPKIGSLSSTHSANSAVCCAGKAKLTALMDDRLIENAHVLGELLHTRLTEIQARFTQHVGNVLGKDLIAALHLADVERQPLLSLCSCICELAMKRGLLLVLTSVQLIQLAPSPIVSEETLLEKLAVLHQTIGNCIATERA